MRGAAPEFFWQEDVVPWVDLHQVCRFYYVLLSCVAISGYLFVVVHQNDEFADALRTSSVSQHISTHRHCKVSLVFRHNLCVLTALEFAAMPTAAFPDYSYVERSC
jgi:hypothetical protein